MALPDPLFRCEHCQLVYQRHMTAWPYRLVIFTCMINDRPESRTIRFRESEDLLAWVLSKPTEYTGAFGYYVCDCLRDYVRDDLKGHVLE